MTKQQEIREGIQRLWCQHCKAMQKTNNTVVECLYNPLDDGHEKAFCASNEDAVNAILKKESGLGVVIKVKCPDCVWSQVIGEETVAMAPCFTCNSTGYIYEPLIGEK